MEFCFEKFESELVEYYKELIMKVKIDSAWLKWMAHSPGVQICVVDFKGIVVDIDNDHNVDPGDELFRSAFDANQILEIKSAGKKRETEKVLRSRTESKKKGAKDKDRTVNKKAEGVHKEEVDVKKLYKDSVGKVFGEK